MFAGSAFVRYRIFSAIKMTRPLNALFIAQNNRAVERLEGTKEQVIPYVPHSIELRKSGLTMFFLLKNTFEQTEERRIKGRRDRRGVSALQN